MDVTSTLSALASPTLLCTPPGSSQKKEYTPEISGLCAMSRCFPFPPPGYTNKGYEKKATTEDVELLTKDHSQGNFIWKILSLPIQFHCP
ncbi:hypothetical protein GYH30_042827 [Glycine max]|nr:hypothetical protein GYH30_042827 [Glycine max]